MEYVFGRCDNYLESVAVGFVACLTIAIVVPVIIIMFTALAFLLPILGVLGLIKRK